MSPRRRPPVEEPERDNWTPPALELVVEEEPVAGAVREARAPFVAELPPREPIPLEVIELAWSLELSFSIEAYLGRSIELAGGFRPILERAGLRMR